MATIRHDTRIACPPDDVWASVSDPVAIKSWFPGIDSATLDGDVRALIRRYQDDPVTVDAGSVESDALEADHDFLLKGDVFTQDLVDMLLVAGIAIRHGLTPEQAMRALCGDAALILGILFFQLLPLETTPRRLAGPEPAAERVDHVHQPRLGTPVAAQRCALTRVPPEQVDAADFLAATARDVTKMFERLKEMKGVRGFHIMAIEWEEAVRPIVEGAGLLPRPVLEGASA